MQTITLQISDQAVEKFYWLLEHFKDETTIISTEPTESEEDQQAYFKAIKEQKSGKSIRFEELKEKRKAL